MLPLCVVNLCYGLVALDQGFPVNLNWLVAAGVVSGPWKAAPLSVNTINPNNGLEF